MSAIPPPTVPPATPPPPGGGSYTPPPPPPPPGGGGYTPPGGSSGDRTLWVVLSYLGILSLIPYLAKKDDPDQEIRWHARNGLALFLVELIVWIVLFVLSFVLPRGMGMGCGVSAIQCVASLGFLVISIICIVKAVGGQRYRIPVITDFAEKSL
ncbi:MAG TPA: DUF4870 domain-containing protein [Thermoanaerobaculia bacterium]|nr:DUF4870 domain-containing protein [Thermoanaerobaculia bacterium]